MLYVRNETTADGIEERLLSGEVIGIASAFRSGYSHTENNQKDIRLRDMLGNVAWERKWGFTPCVGSWEVTNAKADSVSFPEYSCIVYGKSGDEHEMKKLLVDYCQRFDQAGFILCYNGNVYLVNKSGQEAAQGQFTGELNQIETAYTSLYSRARSFLVPECGQKWQFQFAEIGEGKPIRVLLGSFCAAVAYDAIKADLNNPGTNLFDSIKCPGLY